jgi:diguanylate cyclase (GGDEF)-like protein/PAS domain S-box-containing protein
MFTMHLPAAAIAPQDWARWWPFVAIAAAASAVAVLVYVAYRYQIVRRHWRQAAAALHAEQRRLDATLQSVFDPYVLAELVRDRSGHVVDFKYIDTNPAACAWIGLDRDRLIGRRMLDVFPSVATSGLLQSFVATAESGNTAAIDAFPFPFANGEIRWLDIRAVRIDGHVGFTWRDVTERHVTADKLAASEELFRLLAENSSDVVVRVDCDGTIKWVSPSVSPLLGWSLAEWLGRDITSFLSSTSERAVFLHEQGKALTGQVIAIRVRMLSKAGDVHWVEIHAGPFRSEKGAIDGMVASFRIVDAEVAAQRLLERRASTDELTSLLNRKEVLKRIEMLPKRAGQQLAALWCDIDRFKVVNDTYGHAAGDAVLKVLADRIRGCLRSTDDLGARIGGDELLILLHGVRGLQDAVDVAEKLRRSAAEPIPTAAGPITITLSIGVTLAGPDENTDALIARADDAMYEAKKQGRNQVVAFEKPVATGGRHAAGG